MVFSSYLFLFLFLPIFLALYIPAPRRSKNFLALLFSYLFYSWGSPYILPLLIVSSTMDYWISQRYEKSHSQQKKWLAAGIGVNLIFLAYYKYANFFVHETNRLFVAIGVTPVVWTEVALPIGISFFTFQKISYLVDVYTGRCKKAQSFTDYALYVALFPQLIAGPIVRFHDIADQIVNRSTRSEDILIGAIRFSIGLGKKILIADTLGAVADNVFELRTTHLTADYAWLGIICYAFQIYFDFSGYSDMAIGLGRMMGFRFLENFDQPYLARNFTEFWRRWHISLGNWMKEYLYIPLGGNRSSKFRQYVNLWIVFLLSGLWHGASWNFLFWGVFHGFFLSIDKLFWSRFSKQLPSAINILITFFLVLMSWVLFRAETLSEALSYFAALFDLSTMWDKRAILRSEVIHNRAVFTLAIAFLLSFFPRQRIPARFVADFTKDTIGFAHHVQACGAFVALALSILLLSATEFTPFLYFRF